MEQGPGTNQPVRSFNRAFVIVPFGVGFCIVNEQLFVTNATEEQSKVSLNLSYDWSLAEHSFIKCFTERRDCADEFFLVAVLIKDTISKKDMNFVLKCV
jgi:hypothetical protein